MQWLRDGLQIIESSDAVEALAAQVPDNGGVYFVPALAGLGAPYWDPYARGGIFGITRGTTRAHIARAALEAMAYQSADVLDVMVRDAGLQLRELRVDGGASKDALAMQFVADILGVDVVRPRVTETTALGAACMAGLQAGVWSDLDAIERLWAEDRRFVPSMDGCAPDGAAAPAGIARSSVRGRTATARESRGDARAFGGRALRRTRHRRRRDGAWMRGRCGVARLSHRTRRGQRLRRGDLQPVDQTRARGRSLPAGR